LLVKGCAGVILWVNFIFMNVISLITSCDDKLKDKCLNLLDKSFSFLTQHKISNDILYWDYLDKVNVILENWIGLL